MVLHHQWTAQTAVQNLNEGNTMTNNDMIELAYSSSIVDAMRNKDNANTVKGQIPEKMKSDLDEPVATLLAAFDSIVETLVKAAQGDGIWEGLSIEGACLRAWVVAGSRP